MRYLKVSFWRAAGCQAAQAQASALSPSALGTCDDGTSPEAAILVTVRVNFSSLRLGGGGGQGAAAQSAQRFWPQSSASAILARRLELPGNQVASRSQEQAPPRQPAPPALVPEDDATALVDGGQKDARGARRPTDDSRALIGRSHGRPHWKQGIDRGLPRDGGEREGVPRGGRREDGGGLGTSIKRRRRRRRRRRRKCGPP